MYKLSDGASPLIQIFHEFIIFNNLFQEPLAKNDMRNSKI